MFNLFGSKNNRRQGFSLVELLVVLLIMSIIASVAIPLYLNQQQRSYLTLAQADATSVGQEVTSITSDYTSFGSTDGTISLVGGAIAFSSMTGATGDGVALASGPGTTASIPKFAKDSTVVNGSYGAGSGKPWCITVGNQGTYTQYTDKGEENSSVGGSAPTCVGGVGIPAAGGGGGGAIAYTWTDRSSVAPTGIVSIASSSDGTHLIEAQGSGDIYGSTNSGATWTDISSSVGSIQWQAGLVISSDGSHIAAPGAFGNMHTSSNFGSTWTTVAYPRMSWRGIASSADGTKLAAIGSDSSKCVGGDPTSGCVAGGNGFDIWTSADSGATWAEQVGSRVAEASASFQNIVSSSDGTHLAGAGDIGSIWTSSDSGVTWVNRTSSLPAMNTQNFASVASSADGSHLIASSIQHSGSLDGDIYTSSDYGATWVNRTNTAAQFWYVVTSNSSGTRLATGSCGADGSGASIWISTDSGATWVEQTSTPRKFWSGLVSSSDGVKLAGISGGTWTGVGSA